MWDSERPETQIQVAFIEWMPPVILEFYAVAARASLECSAPNASAMSALHDQIEFAAINPCSSYARFAFIVGCEGTLTSVSRSSTK